MDPFLEVAIGSDDLPVVAFNDSANGVVQYRKCVDSGCIEPPVVARIEIPNDLSLFGVSLAVSPSGVPVVAMHGVLTDEEGNWLGPLVYLVECEEADCVSQSVARFENEFNPDIAFAPDETLVMATTTDLATPSDELESPQDIRLLIRTCADYLCDKELSKTDIPMLSAHQNSSLVVGPDGHPTVVLGKGEPYAPEAGGGVAVMVSCNDTQCSSHELFATAVEGETETVRAGFAEGPFFVYGNREGVNAVTWTSGLSEASTTNLLEHIGSNDEVLIGGVAPGPNLRPTVVYLRMLNQGLDDETRQVIVAECDDNTCSSGTLYTVFSGTDDTALNTLPVLATDSNGFPVIAFHTCQAGCKPQYVNVVRCADGCAQAFPDRVIDTWGDIG
jgi:hypothetical protein